MTALFRRLRRLLALALLAHERGLFGGYGGMYALIDLGGHPLRVRFNLYQPRTLATAGAGVRIAAAHDGRMAGQPKASSKLLVDHFRQARAADQAVLPLSLGWGPRAAAL